MKDIIIFEKSKQNPIKANVETITLLLKEGYDFNLINEDARLSYVVAHYWQDFPRFVHNSMYDEELVNDIKLAFTKMGAVKHLAHFEEQESIFLAMSEKERNSFKEAYPSFRKRKHLSANYFRTVNVEENLGQLHKKWLRSLSNFKVMDFFEKQIYLSNLLGKSILNIGEETEKAFSFLSHEDMSFLRDDDFYEYEDFYYYDELEKHDWKASFTHIPKEELDALGYEFYVLAMTETGEPYLLWNCPSVSKESAVVIKYCCDLTFLTSSLMEYLITLPYESGRSILTIDLDLKTEMKFTKYLENLENAIGYEILVESTERNKSEAWIEEFKHFAKLSAKYTDNYEFYIRDEELPFREKKGESHD